MYTKVILLHTHKYLFFFELFYRLLQNIEYSSLCYTRSLWVIYFLYSRVYDNDKLLTYPSLPPFHFGNPKFVFYVCGSDF